MSRDQGRGSGRSSVTSRANGGSTLYLEAQRERTLQKWNEKHTPWISCCRWLVGCITSFSSYLISNWSLSFFFHEMDEMNNTKRKSKGSYHKACRVHQIYNEIGPLRSNFRGHREAHYSNFKDGFRTKKGEFISLFLFKLGTGTDDPLLWTLNLL